MCCNTSSEQCFDNIQKNLGQYPRPLLHSSPCFKFAPLPHPLCLRPAALWKEVLDSPTAIFPYSTRRYYCRTAQSVIAQELDWYARSMRWRRCAVCWRVIVVVDSNERTAVNWEWNLARLDEKRRDFASPNCVLSTAVDKTLRRLILYTSI